MFRKVADVNLLKLENVEDFVQHSILSLDEVKELVNESSQSVEIEQFVIDHVFRSTLTRETFRDESVLDLYTSIVSDLVQWKNLHGKQILCILTIIQGLLCEIERKQRANLNNCFVHACQILMGDGKGFLFNSQLYPQIVDYIIQLLFQHQHLYEILLDDQPQNIETIEENRTIDFHLFEKPLFPYPLTEALPKTSSPPSDLDEFLSNLHEQYPNIPKDTLKNLYIEVFSAENEHFQEILSNI